MEVILVQALVVFMIQALVLVTVDLEISMVVEQVTVAIVVTILMQGRYMIICPIEDACRFPNHQSRHFCKVDTVKKIRWAISFPGLQVRY